MKGMKWMLAGVAVAAALLTGASGAIPTARAQEPGGGKQPEYTMAEYNAYKACADEKVAQARVKCLDDFVTKYQNPAILLYAYTLYYQTYAELKNFPKVIENVDKLLALGNRVDSAARYAALYARAFAFNNLSANEQAQGAAKARQAALEGLKALAELKKPDNVDDKTFEEQKKQVTIFFNGTAGVSAMTLKDYPAAVESFKAVLALTPDEPITNYRLGLAYLAMTPPQQIDGFWALARAVASKSATQQQSAQVKAYLRKLLVNYQQAGCENLVDAQLNEMVQLAGSSAERPASYKILSAADLDAARKEMTIASVIADLKAGGDKGKLTWLAACGLEFPEVPSKVLEVVQGDPVVLKVAFVTSEEEFNAASTPNMEVKVVGQPEAGRIEKDNPVHFTATLASYDPEPFMLHWDKGKVNAEDIPEEKKQPAKKATRPARRPPAKKPPA
jgi:predicted ester cyclase